MGDFFISFSSKDQFEVKQFYQMILDRNFECFKAPESIKPGSTYAREVPTAIKSCNVFLLVVSKYSQDSQGVIKELDCARSNNKKIIALQISPTPLSPIFLLYLKDIRVINCYEHPLKTQEAINALLDEYEKELEDDPNKVIVKDNLEQ